MRKSSRDDDIPAKRESIKGEGHKTTQSEHKGGPKSSSGRHGAPKHHHADSRRDLGKGGDYLP